MQMLASLRCAEDFLFASELQWSVSDFPPGRARLTHRPVYEMICRDVAVMRRRSDAYLNATQILKVAGFDKPQRTRVLEREVQKGEHEKVQGGYGKYQGVWSQRSLEFRLIRRDMDPNRARSRVIQAIRCGRSVTPDYRLRPYVRLPTTSSKAHCRASQPTAEREEGN